MLKIFDKEVKMHTEAKLAYTKAGAGKLDMNI